MKRYPMTTALVASMVVVFAVELWRGALGDDTALMGLGAIRDAGSLHPDYWRLFTYGWLHAGWNHLVMNVLILWWAGRIVERRIGSWSAFATFLLGVFGGGVAIAAKAVMAPQPGVSLGASAGAYALLACAILLLFRPDAARFGQPRWVRLVLIAIAIAGIAASFLKGVSMAGHAAGLAVGLAAGFLVSVRPAGGHDA